MTLQNTPTTELSTPQPTNTSTLVHVKDSTTGEYKPLKICCACPNTRKPRDECVIMHGEDNCKQVIEQHKACLRGLGFKI